jgi:hypothetical protein
MIRPPRPRLAPRRSIAGLCLARPAWLAPPIQVALVLGGLFFPRFALADIAPPDSCTAPGQPCNNAGASSNQPGVCTMTTCSRSMPGPDGGLVAMPYDCDRCHVTPTVDAGTDAAASGTGGADGAGADAAASTGGASGAPDAGAGTRTSGSGCAVAPAASSPAITLGWSLGLVAILTLRRRPSVRRRPR